MTHKLAYCLTLIFLFAGFSSNSQAGKVYKWTDADGNIHYSQTPPPDMKKAKEMKVKVPKSSTPAQANHSGNGKAKNDKKTVKQEVPLTKEQKERMAKNEEIKKKNCEKAQAHLRTISAGGRLYEIDKDGERVYWDDAKRAAKIKEGEKSVEKWCNK